MNRCGEKIEETREVEKIICPRQNKSHYVIVVIEDLYGFSYNSKSHGKTISLWNKSQWNIYGQTLFLKFPLKDSFGIFNEVEDIDKVKKKKEVEVASTGQPINKKNQLTGSIDSSKPRSRFDKSKIKCSNY